MKKYIDAYKLKAKIKQRKANIETYCLQSNHDKRFDVVPEQLSNILSDIDSLQQEQPEVDLENKFGWHNVSEKTPKFGDTVIVACKNKNKEDGIWLYDLIHCWEGKWEPRENWETPLKWISVAELGLNARKEE